VTGLAITAAVLLLVIWAVRRALRRRDRAHVDELLRVRYGVNDPNC